MSDRDTAPEISEVGPGGRGFGERGMMRSAARAVGIGPGSSSTVRIGIALALVTWIPLLVLTAVEGTLLGGPTIPFRDSFGTHTRFLLAIPLFFFAESLFTVRIAEVLAATIESDLVAPDDLERYRDAWRAARTRWDSRVVEAALVIITVAALVAGFRADAPPGLSTWRTTSTGHLSIAGWWYTVVGLPIFQFLLWRWIWGLVVWGSLLWRISRLRLCLIAAHPDRAGGLGLLGVAHVTLSPLVFACSAQAAATFAEQIKFGGATLPQFALPFVAIVGGMTAVSIAPLFFFTLRLVDLRQRGLIEYGTLATRYTHAFDDKWLRGGAPRDESLLGTADLQSLADLGNSFGVIGQVRFIPIARSQLLLLALSAVAPMLPLLLFAYPLDQLIISGIKSLFGV